MGAAVCRHRHGDISATVVDFVFGLFLFLFWLLHADRVVVSHLFLTVDVSMTALSVAVAVIFGAIIPQVETKIAPTMTTMTTTNET